MINLDSPVFPIALLAALGGLRFAVYIAQRQQVTATPAPAPVLLAPDDMGEAETAAADAPTDETTLPLLPRKDEDASGQSFIRELLDAAIIAVALVFFVIRPFLLQPFMIPSGSMIPTLQEGDKVMTTKYTYHVREPHRGEVVVFVAPPMAVDMHPTPGAPPAPAVDYVKRVIGLPGDRIRIVSGLGVFVNGDRLQEPYTLEVPNYDFPVTSNGGILNMSSEVYAQLKSNLKGNELIVPPGHLFVLGDNRNGSHDSHIWGLLERKRLVGKVSFIFWPPSRWGAIH